MPKKKLHYHRISLALFALFFSHVATATLLHHKTKITQRYATTALTNIGEWGLNSIGMACDVFEKMEPAIYTMYMNAEIQKVKDNERLTLRI